MSSQVFEDKHKCHLTHLYSLKTQSEKAEWANCFITSLHTVKVVIISVNINYAA